MVGKSAKFKVTEKPKKKVGIKKEVTKNVKTSTISKKKVPGSKRLAEVRSESKALTDKFKEDLSIKKLMAEAEKAVKDLTTNPKVKSGKLKAPKSEEDYRKEYALQLSKLNILEKSLMDDFRTNNNARAVYPLIQILQQKNAVLSDLWDLKSVDDKVVAVATRVLEPAFRKITMTLTDLVQEVRRTLKHQLKAAEYEKIDHRIVEITKRYSKDLQAHYDQSVEQTAVIAEEEL